MMTMTQRRATFEKTVLPLRQELYAQAIKSTLPMFTKDGVMPADGPATVERVLKSFNPNLKNATVDLNKTYTTEFVKKAG